MMMDGTSLPVAGELDVSICVDGAAIACKCLIVERMLAGIDVILGMDAIVALGGLFVTEDRTARFGEMTGVTAVATAEQPQSDNCCTVDTENFSAVFNGSEWLVSWKWRDGIAPELLKNKISKYYISSNSREEFEAKLDEWIQKGYLQAYDESLGQPRGLIPLFSVVQQSKGKVRPIFDFRELNQHVDVFSGKSDVCSDKLRSWRQKGQQCALIDLKDAYLQLHISRDLWAYQTVRHRDKLWCLTRLGFGLNVAPMIMTSILNTVLAKDEAIRAACDSYVDDIYVDTSRIDTEAVRQHLLKYGLLAKPTERLNATAPTRVLGLAVISAGQQLRWARSEGIDFDGIDFDSLTKRQLSSLCGKFVGIYPVCNWLRMASSYVKRAANASDWDERIPAHVVPMVKELTTRLRDNDPVKGRWDVDACGRATVWCDASSIGVGVVLQVGNDVVEDASWLRKDASTHINMAELDSVIKGLNLAILWKCNAITIKSDSRVVCNWVGDVLTNRRRVKTKAASELLIRRRLDLIMSLITEYDLDVCIEYVKSADNLADALTRVPQHWLSSCASAVSTSATVAVSAISSSEEALYNAVRDVHDLIHGSYKSTRWLLDEMNIHASRRIVKSVISNCDRCHSIDPSSPQLVPRGNLSVPTNWHRLSIDVTKFGAEKYLTIVDCGPSRFAIWRKIRNEGEVELISELTKVFFERGPPEEVIIDNYSSFKSRAFDAFCKQWKVRLNPRAAHRAQGNSIVERNHRTIKARATRTGRGIMDALFWYNHLPPSRGRVPPAHAVYSYRARLPCVAADADDANEGPAQYHPGDLVWVKPSDSVRCTVQWLKGTVVSCLSLWKVNVEVNGNVMPRHVYHLRPRASDEAQPLDDRSVGGFEDAVSSRDSMSAESTESPSDSDSDSEPPRRSRRVRRKPSWLDDYVP